MKKPSLPRSLVGATRFLMGALAVAILLLTGAGLFAKYFWFFEVATHFTVQYAIALIVLLLYYVGRRRVWPALAVIVLLGINLLPISSYYYPANAHGDATSQLRVVTLNLWTMNNRIDLVEHLIEVEQPDVVFLSEVSKRWNTKLQSLAAIYPYRLPPPEAPSSSIVLMSKWPIDDFELLRLGSRNRPTIVATICPPATPKNCIRIAGLHTDRPQGAYLARSRNSQLDELASILEGNREHPIMVLGDLNLTPWSPYFRDFLANASLIDSAAGRGVHPTWMSRTLPFGLVIDHILVSDNVTVVDRRVGATVGSDHFPVIADLAF